MLLKVDDGDGGWVLFDNVDPVHLKAKTFEVATRTDLSKLGGETATILVPKDAFKNNTSIVVGIIEYEKSGERRKVLFTNVAFVCDDRGNTIDKQSVKHGRNTR